MTHDNLTRAAQMRAGRRVEYLSIGWTAVEAVIGVALGIAAASVALLGFGVDSAIEIVASLVVVWRLSNSENGERRERIARKLVGLCFFVLALFIGFDACRDLIEHNAPRASYLGVAYATATVVVMPLLALAKRRVAARLNSGALHADSRQSDICAYLAVILLAGLGLNALFGWWWADATAALGMLPIIIKEGVEAVRGEDCC